MIDWGLWLGLAAVSALAALTGAGIIIFATRRVPAPSSKFLPSTGTAFLFDGEHLVDSTAGARALLASDRLRGNAWVRMIAALSPRFPELEARLARISADGQLTLGSVQNGDEPPLLLQADHTGGLVRIRLSGQGEAVAGLDPIAFHALTEELDQLRSTLAEAPLPIWRERDNGDTVWANTAYLSRAIAALPRGQDLSWPLPRLFERSAVAQGAAGQRQRLDSPDGPAWFDLISYPDSSGRLVFALPADAAVQAESALRDFLQTLTKTFAHLSVGLAVFDGQRQLQLFNPALVDLTGLPVDFLSMRPSLLAVLDALRERNMLPEPKDYRGWRRQLAELEKAAAAGLYEETWSLPGGQTYRVTGRPHPNGGLALVIEDISTEMSRTRRYRADLELGQSVIDAMSEAIAVFSPAGHLVMSNCAYAELWGHEPSDSIREIGIRALGAHWRSLTAPSSIWTEAEEFVATVGDRLPWGGEARLLDGRLIACRFAPLAAGSTLAAFRITAGGEDVQPRLAKAERRRA